MNLTSSRKETVRKITKTIAELTLFFGVATFLSVYSVSKMTGISVNRIPPENYWRIYISSIYFSMILGFYSLFIGAIRSELSHT